MPSSIWQSTSDYPPDVVDVIHSLLTRISIHFTFLSSALNSDPGEAGSNRTATLPSLMASSVWQSTSDYPPDVVDVIQSLSTEISIRFIFYRVL